MTTEPKPEGTATPQSRLKVAHVAAIERLPEGERWLVEEFLTNSSIAVLAATPKAGKTWVALALAVAVASGTPAMGRFHVPSPGTVLLFHAEDDSRAVRERIESIAVGAGLEFEKLPIHVIRAERLRLDDPEDRRSLEALLAELRPKLLVLDPMVRLHGGAESYVGHMSELFGYLRSLQRRFGVAVLLTHHVSKNLPKNVTQPGQAMRGSGDIHAFYDHGATLQRQADGSVLLTLEHRSAPAPDPFSFRLVSRPSGGTSFELVDADTSEEPQPITGATVANAKPASLHDQVLELLQRAAQPLSQVAIRKALKVRNETLTAALRELEARALVDNLGRMGGWRLRASAHQTQPATDMSAGP